MILEKQMKLYGYDNLFNNFAKLFDEKTLPNKILLSGKDGIGKTTFVYHFLNYVFSKSEPDNYDINEFEINKNNRSFRLIQNNTHPNFYRIYLKQDKNSIDINQVRDMKSYINKSTFDNNYKIVFIENVELLNINSVNALLKVLEEPNDKLIFILTHNSERKIIPTLKSRCIQFKVTLDKLFIPRIINNIYGENLFENISEDLKLHYNTPSFYINLIIFCKEHDISLENLKIDYLLNFIIKNNLYKKNNFVKKELKNFIEIFFFNKLRSVKDKSFLKLYSYFNLRFYDVLKFNLDIESFLIEFKTKMLNE